MEETLSELYYAEVLGTMRELATQKPGTFFDPEMGYVEKNDTSETGNVLDMYTELLQERDKIAMRGIYNEDRELPNILDALEPGSIKRRILLAYWSSDEEMPWNETARRISERQSFKSEGFPNVRDVLNVMGKLEKEKT